MANKHNLQKIEIFGVFTDVFQAPKTFLSTYMHSLLIH